MLTKFCSDNPKEKTVWENQKDNIKLGITEIGWEVVDRFSISRILNHWRTFVNMAVKLHIL